MVTIRLKIAAVALGGASLLAGLAGCSADAATPAPRTEAATPPAASSAAPGTPAVSGAAGAGSGTGASSYKDGSYSASGSYNSPGGEESVTVKLTLLAGKVSAVTVVGGATDGNAVRYQKEFSEGIAAKAVGMEIATLKVDKVAGSSLTSGGFNDAVEKIKAKANA